MKNNKIDRYSLQIDFVEDEGFVASYRELGQSATGHGKTPESAIQDLRAAVEDLVELVGDDLPAPRKSPRWESFSGRVTLRLPKSLHYQLDALAERDGVSLNSLLSDILRSGATALESGCAFGAVGSGASSDNDGLVQAVAAALRSSADAPRTYDFFERPSGVAHSKKRAYQHLSVHVA